MRRHVPLLATAVLVVALMGPSNARAGDAYLLPDLRQAPVGCAGGQTGDPAACTDWDVCVVADAGAPNGPCVSAGEAVRLRFTTAADNVGDGPLLIYGSRARADEPTMTARQAFQSSVDGKIPGSYAEAQNPIPATLYYEPAPSHTHWHLLDFEHFQLRTPDGRVVVTDRKTGFCLGDRYPLHDPLAHRPDDPGSPRHRDPAAPPDRTSPTATQRPPPGRPPATAARRPPTAAGRARRHRLPGARTSPPPDSCAAASPPAAR